MQNALTLVYQDDKYLFWRKQSGLASSRGQQDSFLDEVASSWDDRRQDQVQCFGKDEEYGLLNRLDNQTSGLLYFARTRAARDQYLSLQSTGKISKIYYAQVYGRPRSQFGRVRDPVYHHVQLSDRMTLDATKWRSPQQATTYREYVEDDGEKSWLRVIITQWVRHQIRVHLASLGCPIVGDRLYMWSRLRKRYGADIDDRSIQLVSAGVEFDI